MEHYTLYFDGACGPKNPGGTAAYGFTLHKGGERVGQGNGIIGYGPSMTNNVAEYFALGRGLDCLAKHFTGTAAALVVRGDSMLVINQMNGKWKARSGLYYPYYSQALGLLHDLRKRGVQITLEWIPREMNQECDDLSKAHGVRDSCDKLS